MTADPAPAPVPVNHPAAHWSDPDRVRAYRERVAQHPDERREQLALLTHLIPFPSDAPLRVLDLGAGFGVVTAAVLDAFPHAQAVLVDRSSPMIAAGAEYLSAYAGRYHYLRADLGDGRLPDGAEGPFHAVVSSLALQYVPPEGKRALFRECAQRLAPGGCLLALTLAGAPDPVLQQHYDQAAERGRQARGEPPWRGEPGGRRWQPQSVDEHLALLQGAGLLHVDCFWKQLGMVLVGGFRASTPSG